MTVGILSMAVLSYKIFHSRVYPVGMVREIPIPQDVLNREEVERIAYSDVWVKRHKHGIANSLFEKDAKQFKTCSPYYGGGEPSVSQKPQDSTLEEKVTEHEEALKVYSKQVENLEKRLRRFETERMQKLQEADEEKFLQPPETVH